MSERCQPINVINAKQAPGLKPPEGCAPRPDIALVDLSHIERPQTEAFVRAVFARAYGARLKQFYPLLLRITWPSGEYAAVAGVRPAGGEPLFSEHYLGGPIERRLGVERRRIVEIGNLAPASAGQARWLICTMTAFLSGAGFTHVVFTVVPALRNAFDRMRLPLERLACATREHLPAESRGDWGTYYDSKPAVYSGDIRVGFRAFRRLLVEQPELRDFCHCAFEAGRRFTGRGA